MAESAVETELEGWSPRQFEGSTLWVRFAPQGAVASDRGATVSRIGQLPPGLRLSIRALCRSNDVQLDRGELVVEVPPGGDVEEAVERLARVCARIEKLAA